MSAIDTLLVFALTMFHSTRKVGAKIGRPVGETGVQKWIHEGYMARLSTSVLCAQEQCPIVQGQSQLAH